MIHLDLRPTTHILLSGNILTVLLDAHGETAKPISPGQQKVREHMKKKGDESPLFTVRVVPALCDTPATPKKAVQLMPGQLQVQAVGGDVECRVASNSAELRSIASLRAANFFEASKATCSDFAARSLVRLKADTIWEYLEDACADSSADNKDRLVCLFAVAPDTPANPIASAVRRQMDQSCTLPSAEEGSPPRIVLGSLDLTIGPRLGGEHLAGRLPEGSQAQRGRAYISNVSVAPAARRQGIASALIAAAYQHASRAGVTHLYVHAAVDNAGAIALYNWHCGFEEEQEESADLARGLNRPRRKLFRKTVLPLESLDWEL